MGGLVIAWQKVKLVGMGMGGLQSQAGGHIIYFNWSSINQCSGPSNYKGSETILRVPKKTQVWGNSHHDADYKD